MRLRHPTEIGPTDGDGLYWLYVALAFLGLIVALSVYGSCAT